MPAMQKYYKQQAKNDNVEIVAVNLTYTEKNVKNIQAFMNSYDISFPVLLDEKDQIGKLYEVLTLPSTYFIDSKGKVQYRIVGPLDEIKLVQYVRNME